jgi:hypothetical protein
MSCNGSAGSPKRQARPHARLWTATGSLSPFAGDRQRRSADLEIGLNSSTSQTRFSLPILLARRFTGVPVSEPRLPRMRLSCW